MFRELIVMKIKKYIGIDEEIIRQRLKKTKNSKHGDYTFSCYFDEGYNYMEMGAIEFANYISQKILPDEYIIKCENNLFIIKINFFF